MHAKAQSDNQTPLGLIAGNGTFPKLFAEAAKKNNEHVVAVAIKGEADPIISEIADYCFWVEVGQLGKMIKAFKKYKVTRAAMAGGIKKQRFFSPHKIDFTTLKLVAGLLLKRDDEILRTVAHTFEKNGITIVPSTIYLNDALVPHGVLTKAQPSPQQWQDLQYGYQVAKEIGKLDIGQAIVVKNGIILAIEAIEGTDQCIQRGAQLGKQDVVVLKVCKPIQDERFDLPAVGTQTITTMKENNAKVLGLEANHTLMLDPQAVLQAADQAGIIIVGITKNDLPSSEENDGTGDTSSGL